MLFSEWLVKLIFPLSIHILRSFIDLLTHVIILELLFNSEKLFCCKCLQHQSLSLCFFFFLKEMYFIMELISNQHLKSMCLLKIFWLSFCNFDTKEWLGSRFYNCYSQVQSDICSDLQVLGFGEYIEDVYTAYEQHKLETMVIYTPPSALSFSVRRLS
jgi:hypothetical protein